MAGRTIGRRANRRILPTLLILPGLALATPAPALESDQYYAWNRELADATDVVNAKIALEIDAVLERINGKKSWRRMSCHDVAKRIVPRFRQFIFQDIEVWAIHSTLVDKAPATADEGFKYREVFLYSMTGPLDIGTKVPPSPTIEIDGIRLGTDKLSHFFSEGWWYYRWYRNYLRKGLAVAEAEERAVRRGIWWERTILGLLASGVFSPGDLEANYQGMRFFVGLCDGDSPALRKTDLGWRQARRTDLRDHVSPEWDESYQPPIFGKRRWKKVRPVLVRYCPLRDDPAVLRRLEDYARRDRETLTERVLDSYVRDGRLNDPRQFSLDANCDGTDGASDRPREPTEVASGD